VLVKITLIKGGENEHWDYGRIKSWRYCKFH
jgi:hypothetical protein